MDVITHKSHRLTSLTSFQKNSYIASFDLQLELFGQPAIQSVYEEGYPHLFKEEFSLEESGIP